MANDYPENEKYLPGKEYPAEGLLSGTIDSKSEKLVEKFLRGENSRFGEYRVVEYLGRVVPRNGKSLQAHWRIQCSCGWEREISHDHLNMLRYTVTNTAKKNCNSPQHDIRLAIGKRYDRLEIIGHTKAGWQKCDAKGVTSGTWMLLLSCSCGKYTRKNPHISTRHHILTPLKNGSTQIGCGCYNNSQFGLSRTPAHQRWANAKARAKRYNLDFNIEVKDCLAPDYCPVLGIKLKDDNGTELSDNSATVDRINPALGYTKGNVAVISLRANRFKNDASLEELRKVIAWYERVSISEVNELIPPSPHQSIPSQ